MCVTVRITYVVTVNIQLTVCGQHYLNIDVSSPEGCLPPCSSNEEETADTTMLDAGKRKLEADDLDAVNKCMQRSCIISTALLQ